MKQLYETAGYCDEENSVLHYLKEMKESKNLYSGLDTLESDNEMESIKNPTKELTAPKINKVKSYISVGTMTNKVLIYEFKPLKPHTNA